MVSRFFTTCLLLALTLFPFQGVFAATSNFSQTITGSTTTTSSGGGGGGGGGGAAVGPNSGEQGLLDNTVVRVSGIAYPFAPVTWLKEGQIVRQTTADANARFSLEVNGLADGFHNFSLYALDKNGLRSTLYNFSVDAIPGATVDVVDVVIAPTVSLNKLQVAKGDAVSVSGYTFGQGEVIVLINGETTVIPSSGSGAYTYVHDTSLMEYGDYITYVRANATGFTTPDSEHLLMIVAEETIASNRRTCSAADLNNDCRVNLVDFSIAVFWFGKVLLGEVPTVDVDLNDDGLTDLRDFSIMAYEWTG